jgi:hypothetical protein
MTLISPTDRITVLINYNPKRKGSEAFKRFELYKKCKTVAEFISIGGKRIDIINDRGQGFIALEK